MQLSSILTDTHLYTPQLRRAAQKTVQLCSNRWVILLLIVLGILRGILLLMAYPPAHMSDADLFFLYAERIYGAHNWPLLDQVTYPLYAALILVTYKWFGSAYLLIAVQFVMSVSIAPLYYYALKPYSPVLATLVALVTLVDFQSGATFNFTGAEPLYMLLIALTFTVLMRQTAPEASRNWSAGDSTVGILLVLMWLTRTIGRYLILPYGIVFFFYTRSIKRTLTLIAGFVGALLIYMLLSTLVLGDVAGLNATDYAFTRIMHHHPEWVDPDNGPYTKQWLEYTPGCTSNQFHYAYCIYKAVGSWEKTQEIISGTATETITPNIEAYIGEVWENLLWFLSASADIYGVDEEQPGEAQCSGIAQRALEIDAEYIKTYISRTLLPILEHPGQTFDKALAEFRAIQIEHNSALCPPLPASETARDLVDYVMLRNRSFGRPNPHLWYGAVLILGLLLPFARRYLPIILAAGATLVMLAISPAMLTVVENLRYIVPANAMRITLLATLFYIIECLCLYTVDWLLTRRKIN